jgi:hypothetical protein
MKFPVHGRVELSHNFRYSITWFTITFLTVWRLRKHERIHSAKNTKPCHYFTDNVECPFEDLGCKFVNAFPENFSQNSGDTIVNALKKDFVVESRHLMNSYDNTEEIQVISSFLPSTP